LLVAIIERLGTQFTEHPVVDVTVRNVEGTSTIAEGVDDIEGKCTDAERVDADVGNVEGTSTIGEGVDDVDGKCTVAASVDADVGNVEGKSTIAESVDDIEGKYTDAERVDARIGHVEGTSTIAEGVDDSEGKCIGAECVDVDIGNVEGTSTIAEYLAERGDVDHLPPQLSAEGIERIEGIGGAGALALAHAHASNEAQYSTPDAQSHVSAENCSGVAQYIHNDHLRDDVVSALEANESCFRLFKHAWMLFEFWSSREPVERQIELCREFELPLEGDFLDMVCEWDEHPMFEAGDALKVQLRRLRARLPAV